MRKGIIFFTIVVCFFVSSLAGATGTEANIDSRDIRSLNSAQEKIFQDIPWPAQKVNMVLIDKVYENGRLPVIVRLREADMPYGIFSDRSMPRAQIISGLQDRVLDEVFAYTGYDDSDLHVKRFNIVPGMALQVGPAELDALLANPNVVDIVEDIPRKPFLTESVPLVGAESRDFSFSGYTGRGQVIAILDTGVDKNHVFLSGKVVSEACYSSNIPEFNVTSLCPRNAASSTKSGAGMHCDLSINGCDHGTHVAGIAAGKLGQVGGLTISGVARNADIIAIQVFSRIGNGVGAFDSDIIKGLERVYALRSKFSIASVNMSLGGGEYSQPCNNSPIKPIIDLLSASGIATVIASGNNSFCNAIASPACIGSAISVGSTTKADAVSIFSNSASFLSLLAPGGFGDGTNKDILSSVPGGAGTSMQYKPGTSMAAPHVAGAWAVLKQAKSDLTTPVILAALQATGVPVMDDPCTGNRVKPRIDVQAALNNICGRLDCSPGWSLKYKPPVSAKLKKDRRLRLLISSVPEFFDSDEVISQDKLGPFEIIGVPKIKTKSKKGVILSVRAQITVLVPVGTPPGEYAFQMGRIKGSIRIL